MMSISHTHLSGSAFFPGSTFRPSSSPSTMSLARETASKTNVIILSRPHNASSAPWSSTPSPQRSIRLLSNARLEYLEC